LAWPWFTVVGFAVTYVLGWLSSVFGFGRQQA
jgi:hypothetical protein